MPRTIAEKLGHWAAGLRLGDVPGEVTSIATRCLIDVVGVSLAGAETASARRVRRLVSRQYGQGPCTILGDTTARVAGLGAALANGVAAHALDFDDNSYAGIVHGSASVSPAVIAAAEVTDAGGEDLLAGFIAGVEVEYALGKAVTQALYDKGWFSTAVLGCIGAAAGAARVMGSDPELAARAVALAASHAGGVRAVLGTEGKHLLCGRSAEWGLLAALLAEDGASSPIGVFEDRKGFLHALNDDIVDPSPFDTMGITWRLQDPGVDIKLYPICYAGQAAAEAVLRLLAEHRIAGDDVARVVCDIPPLVTTNLTFDRPRTPNEAQFSLHFAVACVLVHGGITLDHLTPEALAEEKLRSALEKVEMRVSDRFADGTDLARDCPEGAFVTVITADGRSHETFNCSPTGSAAKPIPDDDIDAKFRACASRVVPAPVAERWLDRLRNLERVERVRGLFAG